MKKKVLITGGSGFMGQNFCKRFSRKFNITATYNNTPISFENVDCIKTDITNSIDIESVIQKVKPQIVLHTAADSNPNSCEVNKESSYKINVETSKTLADLSLKYDFKLIFISTDLVFSGNNADYSENDTPNPICEYGKQKLESENYIISTNPSSIVCRVPLMFGESFGDAKCFIHPMVEAIRNGKPLHLFDDEIRNPAAVTDILDFLFQICNNFEGIVHVSGEKSYSRLQLGEILANKMGVENPNLIASKQKDVKMPAPRPQNVTLMNNKAILLNYKPKSFEESVSEFI